MINTLQKYDHSNSFYSLHVGLIKPSTLHFQFSYDLTNLMATNILHVLPEKQTYLNL